jgi:hypothetical protein
MSVMETVYAAYGLLLSSSFPLPGMRGITSAGESLPSLRLVLCEPLDLERRWSGTHELPEWRGRQGDGRDLVIERGSAGDVRFTYGDLAHFRLDAEMRQLECAPLGSDLHWQRALIGKVLPSIGVMRGYEALHAAAVESPRGVVAIMAPSGSGKSTLALELLRRGWPLFTDDVLALSQSDGKVLAHPGTPHMNIAQDLPDDLDTQTLGSTLGVLAGERWLTANACATESRPIKLLCLLERGADRVLGIDTLTPNPLQLAPYMLGLSHDPERQRSRFSVYADLMGSATLVRVSVGSGNGPTAIANLIQDAVAHEPGLAVGAIR